MGDLEWTNDLVIRLIEEYRGRPELWDPSHEMYRVQTLKYETWRELARMFGCEVTDLRKKLNSLFASHRREKGKVRAGGVSRWFLYSHMNFLPTHLDQDPTVPVDTPDKPKKPSIRNAPVKEAAPPSDSDSSMAGEAEFLEDEEPEVEMQTQVLIKEEPRLLTSPPRGAYHHPAAARFKRTRVPIKRRIVKEAAARESSSSLDGRLSEALRLLRRAELTRRKDECDSFGEYIADSLRKHDDRTQSMIKQAINNILFEQEMKKYGNSSQQYVVISSMDENPLVLADESDK